MDSFDIINQQEQEEYNEVLKQEKNVKLPIYYKNNENYNDEIYRQIKILLKFCEFNSIDENINFKNEKDKEAFEKFLKLFNNIDQHQRGGVNFSDLIDNLNSLFNGKSKSDSLNDAIKNMETNDFNNEDNIEDNIVYNFANAIGFEENDEKKLTINYKKYNKFIKDYKIFDYEEYTKNIVINYENIYGYLNKLEQVFSSKTNIFSLIEKIIIKYNEIRFYIFNNYFRLEIIETSKTSETSETSETSDKKKYELYFNNDKFKNIIEKYNIPDVNDIHEYIKKIEDYFKDEIKNIIKELKENILNNNNLLTFPDEEELEKGEKEEKREEGKSRGKKEEGESEEEGAVEIGEGEGEGEESRKVEGEREGEERALEIGEGESRGERESRGEVEIGEGEELGKGEEVESSRKKEDKSGGKKYKKYKSSSKKHKKKQKKYNKTKKKNKKKITRKRY